MSKQTKKYELLQDDTITFFGRTFYRIKALISFNDVQIGELGGYIENETNLWHSGNAWVYDNAKVFGRAKVWDNAKVCGTAEVCGNAKVYDNANVSGNTKVWGNAKVCGDAEVCGSAKVCGDAEVCGNAKIRSFAVISESKMIFCADYVGSENGTLTVFNGKNGLIVTRGCFTGSVEEFIEACEKTHGKDSKIYREYSLLIEVAKSRILN